MELATHFGRQSILKVLNHRLGDVLITNDPIGIEVELENVIDHANVPKGMWVGHVDGSLRNNGHEFVFAAPMGGVIAENAIYAFEKYMKAYNADARNSPRTSTHIHVNVDDMEERQLVKFAALYLMYEKHIFRAYSPERESNHYCVPMSQCDGVLEALRDLYLNLSWKKFAASLRDEVGRYGAFNLMAINKFGSVEFRHFTGSSSAVQLIEWTNLILQLKRFAKVNRADLGELLSEISRTGYVNFTYQTFEKRTADKFIKIPAFENMILDGIRLVQTIIHPNEIKLPGDIQRHVLNKDKELRRKKEDARKKLADEIEATRRSLQENYQEEPPAKGGKAKAEGPQKGEGGGGGKMVVDIEGAVENWGRFAWGGPEIQAAPADGGALVDAIVRQAEVERQMRDQEEMRRLVELARRRWNR